MDHLPVFLQLRSRPVLVVGGGKIATRKISMLRRCAARITVVAPRLTAELATLASSGELCHIASEFTASQLDSAVIVVAATGLKHVNASVATAARARGIPVNVVDDPQVSTFIFPAIIDRSPLLVAVSSGGEAPVLARRLREQIEALLPAGLGVLARFMGERRKAVRQALSVPARRRFWERIVGGIVGARMVAGDSTGASAAFERELRAARLTDCAASGGRGLGECYLIGAGPGDPDLLTLRALQLLQQADVILYDRLVPEAILDRARRDAERVFVGKETGNPGMQQRINELLVHYARQGLRVARLKGGDPFIFGRGGEEVEVLAAHGIACIVVPGITAALGAAAATHIPLTHRNLARSVTLVTGHTLDDDALDWRMLARPQQTVVFYMGVARLQAIVSKLLAAGASPRHPAAIIEHATLPDQRTLHGTLETIVAITQAARVSPPALLIVGEVTALAAASEPADRPPPTGVAKRQEVTA
ncbi:MAG TPA: siroheme synthase CysG [Steroidobacteraceae bacterium]